MVRNVFKEEGTQYSGGSNGSLVSCMQNRHETNLTAAVHPERTLSGTEDVPHQFLRLHFITNPGLGKSIGSGVTALESAESIWNPQPLEFDSCAGCPYYNSCRSILRDVAHLPKFQGPRSGGVGYLC
jgi:MoaA/NifB/PqqE/SkfB family radical SAM enzyme